MNEDRLRQSPNVGIIGSSSLLGRELKEMLESSAFPLGNLTLLETEEYAGLLQEFAGDIEITQIISPESLKDVDIAFFACSPEIMQSFLASGASFPELTIDLTQTGRAGTLFLSGISKTLDLQPRGYYVSPHPAAIVVARVFSALHSAFGLGSAFVTVLEAASERGSAGVDELQEQTVSLLNFQTVEKKTFGGQLAFNILPERAASERTEARVVKQIAELLGPEFPLPMITALQAPVFHSDGFSIFAQLLQGAGLQDLLRELHNDPSFLVHNSAHEPSPVGVVGTDLIHVGRVHVSPDQPGSIAMWLAADNLRIAASNAIRTAENIMLAAIGR